jgi:prepilin signal peptidase PulO-like enzyme (type II secretory pathway)
MEPLAVVFGLAGAVWGVFADRISARWPAHEDHSVRKVDWRTPVVLIFGAVALALVPIRFGDLAERALFGAVFAAMVLMIATDLDQRLLPDELNLPLIVLGLVVLFWGGDSLVSKYPAWANLAAAIGVPLVLYLLSKPFGDGALGGGDVKFLAGVGLLIGWLRLVMAVFVGSLLSGLVIGVLLLTRRITLKSYIPFGPFLIIGAVWMALLPAGGS